jgi:hypothetical protein
LTADDIQAALSYAADREHKILIASWNFYLIKTFRLRSQPNCNPYFRVAGK